MSTAAQRGVQATATLRAAQARQRAARAGRQATRDRQRAALEASHAIAFLLQPDPDLGAAADHLIAAMAAMPPVTS